MRYITINDKEYRLEYDINAGCAIEQELDKPLEIALSATSLTNIRAFFWGALIKNYPNITLLEAGHILGQSSDIIEIYNACFQEMVEAGFFGKAQRAAQKEKSSKRSNKSTKA